MRLCGTLCFRHTVPLARCRLDYVGVPVSPSDSKSRRLFDTYGPLYETQESYYEQLEKNRMPELYSYKKGVHLVHGPNMDSLLRGSEYSWVVSFYQAGCGSCESRVKQQDQAKERAGAIFGPFM